MVPSCADTSTGAVATVLAMSTAATSARLILLLFFLNGFHLIVLVLLTVGVFAEINLNESVNHISWANDLEEPLKWATKELGKRKATESAQSALCVHRHTITVATERGNSSPVNP